MYREPRGSIYHPHTGETIPLGTLNVEEYERPAWTFNKLLYIEKEGFKEALKARAGPERHDCDRDVIEGLHDPRRKDLIDKLAEHDEPVDGLLRPRRRRRRHHDLPDPAGGDARRAAPARSGSSTSVSSRGRRSRWASKSRP